METQLTDIRDQQQKSWNTFSPGWKKWDDATMHFLRPMGDAIVEELNIQPDDVVLDIASGTGEPGLTIARAALEGKVMAVDLSEKMLETAKEKAAQLNLTNFTTQQADACELPFDDESFTKVSCRMGFMFFPDMQKAASEMYRVLKPGGKMATSVWYNPPKNVWIGTVMSVISKNIPVPPPPPGSPGMFRCAQPHFMQSVLENAGFTDIREQEVNGKAHYKDFDDFWMQMTEIAAPVVGALNKADEATKQKVKDELKEAIAPYLTEDGLPLDFCALVISGSK